MDNNYKFSEKSQDKLKDVHPLLQQVTVRALEISPFDFGITEGVRTYARQQELVRDGKSQTITSKHLPHYKTGKSHAIDIAVYVYGSIEWDVKYYRPVMQAFVTAAIELGIKIRLGGLWENFIDAVHIELDENQDF